MAGPRQVVDPPAFTSAPHGLLSVVELRAPTDSHWQNGITFSARCLPTMGATTYDECITITGTGGPPPPPPAKADNIDYPVNRGATPFTPFVEFDCSPVGVEADAQRIAEASLAQAESYQVERSFWTGLADNQAVVFPHLAEDTAAQDQQGIILQTSATVVTGAPVDVADGLGLLEDALGDCYNGVGVIHIPDRAIPTFDAWGLLRVEDGRLRTLNGNLVAAGAGYTGSSPAGAAPATGTSWIYATGAVFGYRGSVRLLGELSESFDKAENTVRRIAERTYVLAWDCCHLAVLIQLGVPT